MRQPASGGARRQVAKTTSLPAPVGGWNTRDSLANMGIEYAVKLENWWITPTELKVRPGYTDWVTGITGTVNTLMAYNGMTSKKLFAAAGAAIYDVTSDGAVGAASVSGLTSDKFQHVQTSTAGGVYLYAVNGADYARLYDGTKWVIVDSGAGKTISSITHVTTTATVTTATAHNLVTGQQITVSGATPAEYNGTFTITVTGATTFTYTMGGTPAGNASPVGSYVVTLAISGVATNSLIHVNLFKTRLFFVEKDSLSAWYLPAASIGGTANELDFGSVFRRGGYLVAMATWTLDGGAGLDDYAVWITSEGEVAVYQGTDPSSADTWALVGVFQIGSPMGRKCFIKMGGDLGVLSRDGIQMLSKALVSGRIHNKSVLTDLIQSDVSTATTSYASNYGWQMLLFPSANALILNVPVSATAQEQYVMNTITGAWCKFTGWAANCWEMSDDEIYFGTAGKVCKAWYGNKDGSGAIRADAMQAFSYFGRPTQLKRFLESRPIISSNGTPSIISGLNIDYDLIGSLQPVTLTAPGYGEWDSSEWDDAQWGGTFDLRSSWQFVSGVGYAAAVRLKAAVKGNELSWVSTDLVMELGGVL